MTNSQKLQNEQFFSMVISMTKEGGMYHWPDSNEDYIVKNNKFIGSKTAIEKMKNITTPSFHSKLIVK